MIDLYVPIHIDPKDEDKAIEEAAGASHAGEAVMMHRHQANQPCEAKYQHTIYKDGYGRAGGSGPVT